jgi:hypothetical protein
MRQNRCSFQPPTTMFVTLPPFEQFMPASLVGPGQKHWRAVTLSTESPWFVFVHLAEYGLRKVPQTTLVAWESTLLDFLAGVPAEDCVAIARLAKEDGTRGRWQLQWVEAMWQPAADELEETGHLLLQLEGDPQVRDVSLGPVPARSDRVQLFSAAAAAGRTALDDERSVYGSVPDDFPQPSPQGAVPGAQAKVNVSLVDGVFVDDSAARRLERYDVCQDLLNQLIAYTLHRQSEESSLPVAELVRKVVAQAEKKRFGWGLSPAESKWLTGRLRRHFGLEGESA